MNRRRKIYKGFNRKKRFTEILPVITVSIVLISAAGVYGYSKIKDMDIINQIRENKYISTIASSIPFFNKSNSDIITSDDIAKELDEINKDLESDTNEDINTESSNITEYEDVKQAKTEGWNFYTIQVASVKDDKDLAKFEAELEENKIPFSIIDTDGMKKVQTYSFFDKDSAREYLEVVKAVYPDAFLSEMKIPMLSLEYTSKYEYVGEISNQLNKLITNFEEESSFWEKNKENINKKEYNEILTSRTEIVQSIEQEIDKIDYSGMDSFKNNLGNYMTDINDKIAESSKAMNEEQYNVSRSCFVSCMQGYYTFINIIKGA